MANKEFRDYEGVSTGIPEDVRIRTGVGMEQSDMMSSLKSQALSMQQAKIPDDVLKTMQTRSAESAMAGGLGVGGSSKARTLRDYGVKSLEYMQAGQALGTQVAQLEDAFTLGKAEMGQKADIAREELQQKQQAQNLSFISALSATEQNSEKIALAAADLQSTNRARRLEAENQLIVANTQKGISGIQQYLSDIGGYDLDGSWVPGYFEQMNQTAQGVVNRTQGV